MVFSLKETLEQFFEYLNGEDFEEGSTCIEPDGEGGELEKLKLFCSLFLEAKNIVEISYSYADARALYTKASQSIRDMESNVFGVLAEYADMQAAILHIDRSIYTGYAPQMKKAAQVLKEKTELILSHLDIDIVDDSHECYGILTDNLVSKVEEDKIYAYAIMVVADLYLDRWKTTPDLDIKLALVQSAVEKLESAGNERLASDLAPHIHVIKRFEDRRAKEGKLFIKNGEVAFYYYASLDYRIREELNASLKIASDGDNALSKKLEEILGSMAMISEEMSDIWSGFSSLEFVDTYKFVFNNLKILKFREIENFEAAVELKYYTMGVFELKVGFCIDKEYLLQDKEGMSLSALRHLQTLGTPFALDEVMKVEEVNESYAYISEYADAKFAQLQEDILILLAGHKDLALLPEKKALTFNTEQNRFTVTRVNQIVESFGEYSQRLRSSEFKNHFQYKALVMPVREVRSAIDNWIMYDSSVIDENLAGIRYNESEWLSLNLHSCMVGLLEQPVWVFDQAIESAEVALAVYNLLNLSNTQASTQLSNIKKAKEVVDSKLRAKELGQLKEKVEAEIDQLDEFKVHMSNLLETVEAGSMMTYPDHTIFMEKVFDTIALERQTKKSQKLQMALKDSRSKSMELIKKINDAVVYSQQKMIKLVVSIASVFIALGSLVDMFQLWSDSTTIKSMGLDDASGDMKLEFVLVLAITSTGWLIYDNYFRAKN